MVAVRQFDEDEALQKVMQAFWREGFQATSLDDLVAATGLKRGSLYAAFGDKEAMFLRAYARYTEMIEEPALALLSASDLGAAVAALFDRVIAGLEEPGTPPGCLIAQSMSEAAGRGDAIEAAARQSFARAESAFYVRFLQAQAEGRFPPGQDLRAMARFFAGTVRTMALVHRLTRDAQAARDIAGVALKAVGP